MDKNDKFTMAEAAILNFIYRSQLVYYCTYLHKIWHVGGPTYRHAKILNKNKIQDSGGGHAKILDFCTRSNNSAAG